MLDSYTADWRASVDGRPAEMTRANGLFRAVRPGIRAAMRSEFIYLTARARHRRYRIGGGAAVRARLDGMAGAPNWKGSPDAPDAVRIHTAGAEAALIAGAGRRCCARVRAAALLGGGGRHPAAAAHRRRRRDGAAVGGAAGSGDQAQGPGTRHRGARRRVGAAERRNHLQPHRRPAGRRPARRDPHSQPRRPADSRSPRVAAARAVRARAARAGADGRDRPECLAQRLLADQGAARSCCRMPGLDVTHLGVGVSPLFDPQGELHGAICLFTDLTKVMDLEEQLRLKESLRDGGRADRRDRARVPQNGLATIQGYSRLFDLERDPRVGVTWPCMSRGFAPRPGVAERSGHQLSELRPPGAADAHRRRSRCDLRAGRGGDPARPRGAWAAMSRCTASSGWSRATKCCCDRRSATCCATPSRRAPGDDAAADRHSVGGRFRRAPVAHRRHRQRSGDSRGAARARLSAVLHDEAQWHRPGPRAGAEDHRVS